MTKARFLMSSNILIYAIRGTELWWRAVSEGMCGKQVTLVSDVKNASDKHTNGYFYKSYFERKRSRKVTELLTLNEIRDVIVRCRVLRALDFQEAQCMVSAMCDSMQRILDEVSPDVIVSFPIDRYVSDVLFHLASKRGILLLNLQFPHCQDVQC